MFSVMPANSSFFVSARRTAPTPLAISHPCVLSANSISLKRKQPGTEAVLICRRKAKVCRS